MDYDELAQVLTQEESDLAAAELHGVITAAVCVDPPTDAWRNMLIVNSPGAVLAEAIDALWTDIRQTEQVLQYSPLLPGDDRPLAERVDAMAGWCRGFIDGLIAAGVTDPAALPGEAGEFLRDLQSIGEAEPPESATEDDERAYAELVEYLRAGVGHVYEECRRARPATH